MKILITTGIYPPKLGGPAQYAKNLKETFEKMGNKVTIKTYSLENYLPSGIRHLYFLIKTIPAVINSKVIFTLDTFSVGLPSVLVAKVFGKKCIIRTGGDFLWEQYVERTKKKILLKNFYQTEMDSFSFKEKIIFKLTKWALKNASHIIFSTKWQRDIFIEGYKLSKEKTKIVENYYGSKESDEDFISKEFVASARNLRWKNFDVLKSVFDRVIKKHQDTRLFTDNLPFIEFMKKMRECYAVILVSLGDISPNMILDAIRYNRPFICTIETGIYDRVKEAGIFVDPLNEGEIEEAVLEMLSEDGYRRAKDKVRQFNFIHTWEEIAKEFIEVYKKI